MLLVLVWGGLVVVWGGWCGGHQEPATPAEALVLRRCRYSTFV